MNLKDLSKAINQVAEEKGLDPAKVLEAVESVDSLMGQIKSEKEAQQVE